MGTALRKADQELGDERLVLAARAGDRAALARLFARHQPLLVLLCHRATNDLELARDAAQEACLLAMLNLDRLRRPDRFGPWLAGIGLNVCRRWLRRRWRQPMAAFSLSETNREANAAASSGSSPEAAAEAADLAGRVLAAVGRLPPGQRNAVELHYLAGLSQQEVAARLGIAPGAVKTRLHKARVGLRRRLWQLWREEFEMAAQTPKYVPMTVTDVRRGPSEGRSPDRFVVVLQEEAGRRGLPIWVGPAEGKAIASLLADVEFPRPDQYHFADRLLSGAGGRIAEVRITKLADVTYYAEAVIDGPAGTSVVDARPSDALALALMQEAAIVIAESLLERLQEGTPGSWRAFKGREQEFPLGAREIAAAAREDWERNVEEFRRSS